MRQAVAVGLTALVLVAFPLSARSDTAETVAVGAVSGVLGVIVCGSLNSLSENDTDEDEFARRGWLVGVGGSYAIETFEDDEESEARDLFGPSVSLSVDNSLGINGRAGYRCHRRISAEVEVEWLNGFESDLSESSVGKIATIDAEPVEDTANVKGYLLTGRFQPFLLVGGGAMTAEFTGLSATARLNNFAMRFGGGIDLYATKHVVVSVGADYVLPFGSLEDLDYISIGGGFEYRF